MLSFFFFFPLPPHSNPSDLLHLVSTANSLNTPDWGPHDHGKLVGVDACVFS